MARTKLIAKYAALDTPDLGARIAKVLAEYVAQHGIDELPVLNVVGRWTGRISLSEGGWHDDFELNVPALACMRIDRYANVEPDPAKIEKEVERWRSNLNTETEDDPHLGVSDDTFRDSDYLDDVVNDLKSAAYGAELDSFLNDEQDMLEYDQNLTQIDEICRDATLSNDEEDGGEESDRLFAQGFNAQRIESLDEFKALMEAMNKEAEEGGGVAWTNPDIDWAELEDFFNEPSPQERWLQFVDDLRNGRFGELPEDYDGLAEAPEEEEEE